MSKKKSKSSRELGLEVAAICGKYFFRLDHLHYGYWPDGLDVNIANLHKAQQEYTDFLVSHIPEGVKTILDVGCGKGYVAKHLVEEGYRVDCVSPSPFLSERAHSLLGAGSRIYRCEYEQLATEQHYDMVMFSESFQYIGVDDALRQTIRFATDDGYLLICDVFKADTNGKGVIGGGHKLRRFYKETKSYPFELVDDIDITEQTAPNMDILDDALKNVIQPVLDSSMSFLAGRYPLMSKFLRWKYRRRIEKLNDKYFKGGRRSEDFKKYKSYRFLLYRKRTAVPSGSSGGEVSKAAVGAV